MNYFRVCFLLMVFFASYVGAETTESARQGDEAESKPVEQNDTGAGKPAQDTSTQGYKDTSSTLRVNYVPQFIRDQIRDEVKKELTDEVIAEVMDKAAKERWGVKDSWPAWLNRIAVSGDVRFRIQADKFGDDNTPLSYPDWTAVNANGGFDTNNFDGLYFNTTEDRERMAVRFRLALEAKHSDYVDVGMRIATGKKSNPVSANVTLGNQFDGLDMHFDRAYINWHNFSRSVEFIGGKMPNPWVSTSLVWDTDLNFDGAALKTKWKETGLFLTLGAFPVHEEELSSEDTWLYGSQFGINTVTKNSSQFVAGVAYYSYENIQGKRNAYNSTVLDFTAPDFFQKGNTVFNIRNSDDPLSQRRALSSDYDLVDLTLSYSFPVVRDLQFKLLADWVKNISFDPYVPPGEEPVEEKSQGWLVGFRFGTSGLKASGDWSVALQYRSLERDAVVDAYTDSDFHLGGTDAEGYDLTANVAVAKNTWASLRIISADEIDGPTLSVDTYQLDINSRF